MANLCTYFLYCGPQSPSYSKLRPAETFSIRMWPLDGFELETPALEEGRRGRILMGVSFLENFEATNVHTFTKGKFEAACCVDTCFMLLIVHDFHHHSML
jgi:hypothetical protein